MSITGKQTTATRAQHNSRGECVVPAEATFRIQSAFHLLAQKACGGLRQLLIRLRQGGAVIAEQQHHTAHQIALTQNRCRHTQMIFVIFLGGLQQIFACGIPITAALFHDLFQRRGIGLVHQLPLGNAMEGNDAVPVGDGCHTPSVGGDGLAHLCREILQIPHGRVFAKNDAPYVHPDTPCTSRAKERKKVLNSSLILPAVAQKIAQLKGIPAEEVERATTENTIRLFRLPIEL